MRKLETIQTRENLNEVWSVDEPNEAHGNACHQYEIYDNDNGNTLVHIQFQDGARKDLEAIQGVLDGDLLEIVRDRMSSFQKGKFSSDYNARALYHIEEALKALNDRVEDRIAREVLGTYNN